MPARVPMYKGTGFVPVVSALKAHPRGPTAVPAALQHYLDGHVVVTGWYPEADFMALTECLAHILEDDGIANVWTYFGKVAAERDLKGTQDRVPVARRVRMAGIYRRFAADEEVSVATWLARMTRLWTLYHDTGYMIVGRSAAVACGAVFRVYEYQFLTPHFIELLTAYWNEYVSIMALRASVRFGRSSGGAEPFGEWEFTCEHTPGVADSLAAFPMLA